MRSTSAPPPPHVAIIMDGNGRWAELRGRDRTFGHLKGARVAKKTIEACAQLGVEQLTLYAFSTENWFRPKAEVAFLMKLLGRHLRKERAGLVKNNIRFSVIGDLSRVPVTIREEIFQTVDETRDCTGMGLTFALSYGSRQEITAAVRAIAEEAALGKLDPTDIDEDLVSSRLQSSFMTDPDLIIRTSGEYRLSNFLLWQAAYSELYVTPVLWPDFTQADLEIAFERYAVCERRFGQTTKQVASRATMGELIPLKSVQLGQS